MKLNYTKLLPVLFSLIFSVAASANVTQLPFNQLSIDQGLSQVSVKHMMQDSHGFLWFATDGGLNFYNGYNVKQVDGPDNIFKGQTINHIFEDSQGLIWITTDYLGVYTYNPRTHAFETILDKRQGYLGGVKVFEDENNDLWLVTFHQLMKYNRVQNALEPVLDLEPLITHEFIVRAVQDIGDYIFVGAQNGLFLYQKSTGVVAKLPRINETSLAGNEALININNANDVKSFYFDYKTNDLYIGSVSGLFVLAFDDIDNAFEKRSWPSYQTLLPRQNVWQMVASDGTVFAATDNGVFKQKINGDSQTPFAFAFDLSETHDRLEHNQIYSLLIDNNRGLWVGSALDGAFQIQLSTQVFTNVLRTANSDQKLSHNKVNAIEHGEDTLWIATDNGLNSYQLSTGEIGQFLNVASVDSDEAALATSKVVELAIGKDDTVWLNTDAGLVHFDPNREQLLPLPAQNDFVKRQLSQALTVFVESNEKIWLRTFDGFYIYNANTGTLQNLELLNQVISPEITQRFLGKMSDRQLLISSNDYLYAVDTETFELFPVFPKQSMDINKGLIVTSWLVADDVLWLGMNEDGLYGLDSESLKVKYHLTAEHGGSDQVYGLAEDSEGDIWFSSHNGIYKFNKLYQHFTKYDDGVVAQEFNEAAFTQLADGQLVYGSTKGFVLFDPIAAKLRDSESFDVHIVDMTVLSRKLDEFHDSLNGSDIHLEHDDFGIELQFSTLDYAEQDKTLYHYWLTGSDNIDYPHTMDNKVMFPSLEPGAYQLNVEAVSPLTGRKSSVKKLSLFVGYPPFASPLAFILYFLAIILICSLWVFRRYHQRQMLVSANRKLVRSEERLELALQASNSGVWDWDGENNSLYSRRIPDVLGYVDANDTMTVKEHMEYVHPDDLAQARTKYMQFANADVTTQAISYRMRDINGEWRWFQDLGQVVERDESGRAKRITGTFTDVTESRVDKEKAELFAIALEHTRDWSLITNEDFSQITANNAYYEAFNLPFDTKLEFIPEHTGMSFKQILSYREVLRDMELGEHYSGVEEVTTRSGAKYYVLVSISLAISPLDGGKYYVFILSDITAQKEAEKELRQLANFDFLTGLPNRSLLHDRIHHAICLAERNKTQLALLFLDLNKFKPINDSLGHNIGDLLLKEVANRLTSNLRGGDTVARLGGDEFVILVENAKNREQIAHVAEKLIYEVSKPAYLEEHRVSVSPSVGICFYPEHGGNAEELMHSADIAMYEAKSCGAGKYAFYETSMYEDTQQKLFIENRLKLGISKKEFVNHYQPILDINSNKVVGVELLLRWFCDGEYRFPVGFIELAEEQGLIIPMTHDALVTGMWDIKQLRKQHPDLYLSVNLSMQHLKSEKLPQQIASALKYVNLPADALRFEITENVLMEEPETVIRVMSELKEQGVLLALDDFGTGYSSLSYLSQLPLSILKIDKSFVSGIGKNTHDESIIDAILSMSQSLNLITVAEGTETLEQIDYLKVRRCDYVQGFYFAKAKQYDDLENYLELANSDSGDKSEVVDNLIESEAELLL